MVKDYKNFFQENNENDWFLRLIKVATKALSKWIIEKESNRTRSDVSFILNDIRLWYWLRFKFKNN
jgi:hypothetical protein